MRTPRRPFPTLLKLLLPALLFGVLGVGWGWVPAGVLSLLALLVIMWPGSGAGPGQRTRGAEAAVFLGGDGGTDLGGPGSCDSGSAGDGGGCGGGE